MKVRTSKLSGVALDWAVVQCQRSHWLGNQAEICVKECGYSASTRWEQAGPIIDQEGILLRPIRKPGHAFNGMWLAKQDDGNTGETVRWHEFQFGNKGKRRYWRGETALIAAMRCYVASKMGEVVDVPEGLLS